jgi:hypothetical protein
MNGNNGRNACKRQTKIFSATKTKLLTLKRPISHGYEDDKSAVIIMVDKLTYPNIIFKFASDRLKWNLFSVYIYFKVLFSSFERPVHSAVQYLCTREEKSVEVVYIMVELLIKFF